MHPLATTNVYICRGKRERERQRRAFLERKNLEYDRFFWKAKSRFGNVSKNFHAKFRAPACVRTLCATREGGISSTKEEIHGSPHMFYQGTLWYRRRFKGDSTMFTECRGPRRIDGGREGRAKRCIEACMPLVGLSCKPLSSNPRYFATPPYSIFRSTSIPVTLPRATTSPPVTTPPCTPFPPFLRASSSHSRPCNRFFAHLAYHVAPVSKRDFPRCTGRTTRDSLEIPVKGDLFGREESSRTSFLMESNEFSEFSIRRGKGEAEWIRWIRTNDPRHVFNSICRYVNEVCTSLESLCSYYALPRQSNLRNPSQSSGIPLCTLHFPRCTTLLIF